MDLDGVEEEQLKSSVEDKKAAGKSIGRNNQEYRAIRRQSIKANQGSAGNRGRQGSLFGLKPAENPEQQKTPPRKPAIIIPQPKKRAKEAVGRYLLGDALGRGQFGLVFKGIDSENGAFVAIKQLKSNQLSEDSLQAFEGEITLLSQLDHPAVVRYLDCVRTTDHVNLVLEYCDGGVMTGAIKKFGKLPEKLCAVYIYQCLQGLAYLHSKNVVHRDIKGANILLTKSGKVKLADFGISTTANNPNGPDGGVGFGSPYWMAPEVIEMELVPNEKADIWSLGCTVIELYTGNPPYHEYHPMGAIVKCVQDEHPPLPKGISKDLEDFLLLCFQKDRDKRPSASELLNHSWFSQLRESEVKMEEKSPEKAPQKTSSVNLNDPRDSVGTLKDELGLPSTSRIRVFGESIRQDAPFKAVFITSATTSEEVVQLVLTKYNVTDDPSGYALYIDDTKTGETKMLEDVEILMPLAVKYGEGTQTQYKFSLRAKPDAVRRKEGLLLKKKMKKLIFTKPYMFVRVIMDLDERYVAFYHGDRPSNEESEDPIEAIYNLRMMRAVTISKNDPATKKFEFVLFYANEQHVFRASSSEELESWVNFFRKGIAMARPLNLGPTLTSQRNPHKKPRESKVLDANELLAHRPRLSSARSLQSQHSQHSLTDSSTPSTPSVPEDAST